MESLLQDLRYGLRMLFKNPGFTALTVFILALGISANTTIFSLIDGMWFRPLPVKDPGRLVRLFTTKDYTPFGSSSYPDYLDFRDNARSFAGIATYLPKGFFLGEGTPELIFGDAVSGNYFPVLGVQAALGRTFLPEEDQASSASTVAVISHGFWQRRFGADPNTIGKSIKLNGKSTVIVGIMPKSFKGLDMEFYPDVWVTYSQNRYLLSPGSTELDSRDFRDFVLVGRLRPTVTTQQAQSEMEALSGRLAQAYPDTNKNIGVNVIGDASYRMRQWVRPSLLLGAIVAVVLLIACANVAALLMARGESRRVEVAIRQALGAGRIRLFRQWLTESLLLALLAGAASLFLSSWLIDLLPTLFPPQLGSLTWGIDFRLDMRVLLFILFMCVMTALLFGLAPALRAYKAELVPSLKGDPSLGNVPRRFSAHDVLVVGQVALSMAVLIVAGLLFRSFMNTLRVDPGFEKENRLLVFLAPDQAMQLYHRLSERLHGQPWMRDFSFASRVPLWPTAGGRQVNVSIPSFHLPSGKDMQKIKYTSIGPNYFRAMGTRILKGRDFTDLDHVGTARAVLVNETMARRYWPNENPIGKVFQTGTTVTVAHEIIGVVQDGKYLSVHEDPEPYIFFPFAVMPMGEVELIVETIGDPRGAADLFKQELRRVDKTIPIMSMTTLRELLRSLLYEDELAAKLVGILAALGLILTGVGVYGVVAFAVSRRTREIGIRKALGAQSFAIMKHVLRRGLWLALLGCGLGLVISVGFVRLLSKLLFEISPTDPATFVEVLVLLFSVVILASYLPARRASKVDPIVALRYE